VIATPAGGVADHLRDGQNGIAVGAFDVDAMASAIVALTRDTVRRNELSRGARSTAVALDWESELDRLDASYRALLVHTSNSSKRFANPPDIFENRAATRAAI
jgi:glycosyltransferase involved in cell wall biosynthesis